jgi:hypothetical protein
MSTEKSQQESCPICLDTFSCARITKCGHCFCLPCLIRHVHSHADNNPYKDCKCPCCSIPLHLVDIRPVQLVTVNPPMVNQQIRFTKLHRAKVCPAPFLPVQDQPRRSSPRAAPSQTDADAAFCKFNYIDPVTYQQYLTSNLQELLERQSDGGLDAREVVFATMAVEMVQKELQAALEETAEEIVITERFACRAAGIYQQHPMQLLASSYKGNSNSACQVNETAAHADQQTPFDSVDSRDSFDAIPGEPGMPSSSFDPTASSFDPTASSFDPSVTAGRYRGDSVGSEFSHESSEAYHRRSRGDSITSHDTDTLSLNTGRKDRTTTTRPIPTGSMYTDGDEGVFYQTNDGQLCFLSGFNMNCLRAEFSAVLPEESALLTAASPLEQRKLSPLPDILEGKIVEIERVQLTPEMRQRLRVLSHLPLYSDVTFVEIMLGNMLSPETKKIFKKDFAKRKQVRMNRLNAEKREDDRTRRNEEERINDLKARMHRIDPSDEFFQPSNYVEETIDITGDDFAPLVSITGTVHEDPARSQPSNGTRADPAASFSAITRTGGAFPALGSSARNESDFPALGLGGGQPSKSTPKPSWGRPAASSKPLEEGDTPSLSARVPEPGGKRKSKGKKVVLFSTGAQRGPF